MADRDLLNKLLASQVGGEDLLSGAKPPAAASPGKLGVKERAREIGHERGAMPLEVHKKGSGAAEPGTPAPPPIQAFFSPKPQAHKAAYFNKDVQATAEVNPRARPQQALRGAEGALDLKRIVLPAPAAADEAGAAEGLSAAFDRMQPTGPLATSLAGLVGRQSAWSQLPSIKPEHILARLERFTALVALRRAVLQRLGRGKAAASPTIAQALEVADGLGREGPQDVEQAGDALIAAGEQRGSAMRARLAKVMRVKR